MEVKRFRGLLVIALLSLTILGIIPSLLTINTNISVTGQTNQLFNSTEIVGDAEFNSVASTNGWSGDGSSGNPFIIENLHFLNSTGSFLLKITDTSVYFKIQNNIFDTVAGKAIILLNTSNAEITGNTFQNSDSYGIEMTSSNSISVSNNNLENNSMAVYISKSNTVSVINNNFSRSSIKFIHIQTSNKVIIDNNHVFDAINNDGITVATSQNVIIQNNNVSASKYYNGFVISNSNSSIIQNNIVEYGKYGVKLTDSQNITVQNNDIKDVEEASIFLIKSSDTNIINNTMSNGGISFIHYTQNTIVGYLGHTITGNTIQGREIYYAEGLVDTVIDTSTPLGQIILLGGDNITITGVNIQYAFRGIEVQETTNLKVQSSTFSNLNYGLYGKNGENISVIDNTFTDLSNYATYFAFGNGFEFINNEVTNSKGGIYLGVADNSITSGNTFRSITGYSVLIQGQYPSTPSKNNTVSNNQIYDSLFGMRIENVIDTLFNNNIISNITQQGMQMKNSRNNTITDNSFTGTGFFFDYSSNPTYFYQTKFDNNTVNGKEIAFFYNNQLVSKNPAQSQSIFDGSSFGQVLIFNSSKVVISNLDLSNGYAGVLAYLSGNVTIIDSKIENMYEYGIYPSSVDNITIINTQLLNNKYGIRSFSVLIVAKDSTFSGGRNGLYLYNADNSIFKNNTFSDSGFGGLYTQVSSNLTLLSNRFVNTGWVINDLPSDLIKSMSDNIVNDKSFVYIKDSTTPQTITDAGQVLLYNASNVIIRDSKFGKSGSLIQAYGSDTITLQNITIEEAQFRGIYLDKTSNVIIDDVIINSTKSDGVKITNGENISINYLFINDSQNAFIANTVTNLNVTNSQFLNTRGRSMEFNTVNNFTISNNLFYNGYSYGLQLHNSKYGVVSNNIISIVSAQALRVLTQSDYLDINYNDFISEYEPLIFFSIPNYYQVNLSYNYYANFVGSDADNDGIIDIPYIVGGDYDWQDDKATVYNNNMDTIGLFSKFRIISPEVNSILSGIAMIEWSTPLNLFEYSYKFDVDYSLDGSGYTNLIENTNLTSIEWDTSNINYSKNVVIRVTAKVIVDALVNPAETTFELYITGLTIDNFVPANTTSSSTTSTTSTSTSTSTSTTNPTTTSTTSTSTSTTTNSSTSSTISGSGSGSNTGWIVAIIIFLLAAAGGGGYFYAKKKGIIK